MNNLVFAPGGMPAGYNSGKRRFPQDLPAYLAEFGLNGFEYECGRGVKIAEKTYEFFAELRGIALSLHAPYYISLSGKDEETRLKSITYILQSAEAAKKLGAQRIVIHSGSCAKMSREEALELAKDTLKRARNTLMEAGLADIIICPETMGKINQLGTLKEVIELCKADESFLPCVDFGHLNARSHGAIKTKADYERIFDTLEAELGFGRVKSLHIHFSKIEYTSGGEKTHLTFDDAEYGPDFEPLLEVLHERGYKPFIVCESQGTQAEDAMKMREYYESLCN
jgi:deoxyribonuclease-4